MGLLLPFDIKISNVSYSHILLKNSSINFKFCCNTMIPHLHPNVQTQFAEKEEVGSYDNIAMNQRIVIFQEYAVSNVR